MQIRCDSRNVLAARKNCSMSKILSIQHASTHYADDSRLALVVNASEGMLHGGLAKRNLIAVGRGQYVIALY